MVKNYLNFVLGTTALVVAQCVHAAPTLFDGFETANLTAPSSPTPALNTGGFTWGTTNYTQVVGTISGVPTAVYGAAGTIKQVWSGSNFVCKTGTYCLRFAYGAGSDMSEQRFSLGKHYPDAWIGYWIRVPTNFSHGNGNNKFAAFWTNVYDGSGDVTWQTRPTSGGSAKLVVQDGGVAVPEVDAGNAFINAATDRGRWMQVAIRMKPATSSSANDGIIEFYRRWSNESTYSLLYKKTNARFYDGGQGVHQGYLMGWANAPYSTATDWLLDDFTVSTDSLVSGTTTTTPNSPPTPPILQVK